MDRGKKGRDLTKQNLKHRLALTAGEPLGVGAFVIKKSLEHLGPVKNFQFCVWANSKQSFKIKGFKTLTFTKIKQALNKPFDEKEILHITSQDSCKELLGQGLPGPQLQQAVKLCLNKKLSGLVTGPVSKTLLQKSHKNIVGQTSLLKVLANNKKLYMCFRGHLFNVILFSDHVCFKSVKVKANEFKSFLKLCLKARQFLPLKDRQKPLGVLGLNPHAGEGGLLGLEEKHVISPVLKLFTDVEGPLVPDAAFLKKNWAKYSFFVALYHDQGLIPFKMAHQHKGFAQTLGLSFLRLGVDHGTGKGLKTTEICYHSFYKALKEAIRLIKAGI